MQNLLYTNMYSAHINFTITQTSIYVHMLTLYASIVSLSLIINVEPYKKSMAYLTRSDAAFLMLLTLVYTGVNSATIDIITPSHHLNNTGIINFYVTWLSSQQLAMFSTLYDIVILCTISNICVMSSLLSVRTATNWSSCVEGGGTGRERETYRGSVQLLSLSWRICPNQGHWVSP